MNEPIEREGLVYSQDELRRYFELPSEDPDAIIGICDTKDKGADYAFLPVAYVYDRTTIFTIVSATTVCQTSWTLD